MKKKILYLFCFVSVLFCQDLKDPDEAQEDLKQNKKDLNQIISQELDDITKQAMENTQKDTDLEDPKNKSGFLLGTGVTLKELGFSQIITGFESLIVKTPSLDVGLLLGYQYYTNKQIAFRISGMINTGGKAELKASKIQPAIKKPKQARDSIPATLIREVTQVYYPIKLNIDAKFLFDIYTYQKHNIGVSLGIGYEVEWLIADKASAKVGQGNPSSLEKLTQKPNTLRDSAIYPTIGLHYYYGKHQFEINYKFAEYSFVKPNVLWGFNTGNTSLSTYTKFFAKNSLSLNYIYRF